jgi:hypothetical protein
MPKLEGNPCYIASSSYSQAIVKLLNVLLLGIVV